MTEPSGELIDTTDDIPFRLRDMKLKFNMGDTHPIFNKIDEIRKQWKFMILLARHDWKRANYVMLGFGIIAFVLGAISSDIVSGGDTMSTGMDGLLGVGSFSFFQMLLSIVAWVVFLYFVWVEFPVMRVHSITMMLIWNGMVMANVFFHEGNPNWPADIALADMMYGTLIMLVVIFFTYFFWKAVTDTRDLHVRVHHVHEDVRIMERDMHEHALGGWSSMLLVWFLTTFISAWSGINFVASRNNESYLVLFTHILSGIIVVPLILMIIWYPQRMLGDNARISTSAALTAEIEMKQGQLNIITDAKCPECAVPIEIKMEMDGQILVPCPEHGCETFSGVIGSVCSGCDKEFPSRFDCQSCNTNIPYVDTIPDSEAW
tara:strand:+ start:144 stop:1268 length:1125 start_codon:yes stop_codon:yes gene_type:complete